MILKRDSKKAVSVVNNKTPTKISILSNSKKITNNKNKASTNNKKQQQKSKDNSLKDVKSLSDNEENKKAVKKKQSTTFSIKNIPKNSNTLLGYDWIKGINFYKFT
jgi:hypothetical protein